MLPKFEKSLLTDVTPSPAAFNWMREMVLSKLDASRSPSIAPPKFEAVYSVRPLVEALKVVSAPSPAPG